MTITIIGGSGFIGTYLCKALEAVGEPFYIADKKPSELYGSRSHLLDIRDAEQIAQHIHGQTIIHLAAEHRDNVKPSSLYRSVNVDGTRNLCRAASIRGVHSIVFTSSVAIYGFTEPGSDEDAAFDPFNEYGRTKLEAEKILKAWVMEDPEKRSLTIVRPTVVFGPGNRGNVYNLLRQIASRRYVTIGNGLNRKSIAYVENVVAFLRHATKLGPGIHIFNYVDEPAMSINDLVSITKKRLFGKLSYNFKIPYALGLALGYVADGLSVLTGRSFSLSAIRVKKFAATTHFRSSAHHLEGFQAPFELEEGLNRTIDLEFLTKTPPWPIFYTE